jgi:hypothetical protein
MSTLPRYDGSVLDNVPRPVPNAQVYIYAQPNPFTTAQQADFAAKWTPTTVSLDGASLATVYNDNAGLNPVTQPLQASNTDPTFDGNANYYFYAVGGLYTVVEAGGTLAVPSFLFDQNLILAASGGALFQVNGVTNSSQTLLNLVQGTNITLAASGGNVTINGTAAPITFKVNNTNASSQVIHNLLNGTGISIVDGGSGNITINATAAPVFQVNGTPTSSQSTINFINGTNVTVSNPSAGNIQFVAAYPVFQTNSVNNTSQTTLNFVNSSSITFSNPSAGIVEAQIVGGGSLNNISLQITSAQLKTLRGTPLQILATPGSNEQYKIVNATFEFEPVTTPYATVGKNDLSIYVDTTKATIFKGDSQGLIDQTTKTYEDAYALVPVSVTVTPSITFPNPVVLPFNATAQSAAISGQSLTASLPYSGAYRVSWYAVATTAATTSSTLGGTKGFQLHYTDVDTNAAATTPQAGAPSAGVNQAYSQTNQGNTVGTNAEGVIFINAKTGTALTFDFDYTSVGGTALQYAIHVRVEYIDQVSSVSTPATTSYSKFFTTDALSTNQAIMIANVSGAEYTAGDGTLTVNVWYELLTTV